MDKQNEGIKDPEVKEILYDMGGYQEEPSSLCPGARFFRLALTSRTFWITSKSLALPGIP